MGGRRRRRERAEEDGKEGEGEEDEENKQEVLTGTGILLMSTTSSAGNSSSSASTRALKVPSSIKVVFKPNLTHIYKTRERQPEINGQGKAPGLSSRRDEHSSRVA